ncbi:MAG: toprim domain-containing protein [Aequorivita sp.]
MEKAITLLTKYEMINTFFDNDTSSRKATKIIKSNNESGFKDCSIVYKNHKDLNEYLISL